MLSVLAFIGDAFLWSWLLMKRLADTIVGFAGFPEQDEDETQVPAWVGWLVWFIAVAGLLGNVILVALQGGISISF